MTKTRTNALLLRPSIKRTLAAAGMLALLAGAVAMPASQPAQSGTSQTAKPKIARPGAADVSQPSGHTTTYPGTTAAPKVVRAAKSDTSPPLRDIKPVEPLFSFRERDRENIRLHKGKSAGTTKDTVVQKIMAPLAMPTPIQSFEGVPDAANAPDLVAPPDSVGDVGPNHYVQMVNSSFAVYSKAGVPILTPRKNNTIWAGFGGDCQTHNDGDPIVVYDPLADRWLLSQFTFTDGGPFYECMAVSTGPDPTGTYYRYAFQVGTTVFEDYPHIGVWPDGYYMTSNEFDYAQNYDFVGAGNFAFDRAKMLAGDPTASYIYFHRDPPDGGALPSDLDGLNPPPAGAPNYFFEVEDNNYPPITQDQIWIYRFHADFAAPHNSYFIGPTALNTAPFDSDMCSYARNCIPQPGGSTLDNLDAISDRLMYRVAYRNFGDHESVVLNHTVDADGSDHAGVRWYEVRDLNGTPSIYQQGTYAPDSDHRWMASAAQDRQGNMAIGFSVSGPLTFPSVRYAGRLASDPLGQLSQGEAAINVGTGSQTLSSNRWGDYSDLTVDPTDDCTFWYTQEYYATTSGFNWNTRIGSFKFPGCAAATPTVTVTGTPPTATQTGTPTPTMPTSTPSSTRTPTRTPTVTPTPVCTLNYTSTDVPKTILDLFTVRSSLTITNGPTIGSVQVRNIQIAHTYPSDLEVYLISPAGTRVLLFSGICGGNPDWTQANTGFNLSDGAALPIGSSCPPGQATYRPQGVLSVLAGQPSSGTWQLEISDVAPPDEGTLYAWGLRIGSNTPCVTGTVTTVATSTSTSTPTATNTPPNTATSTPTVAAVLTGHVTWQGRPAQPSALQQLPITLTLRMGTTEMNYPTTTTDASGYFTVSTAGLPQGTYNYRVKGPKYLANSGTTTITGGADSQEMGLMRVGDSNNDNVVNVADFNILRISFGKATGDPGYDDRAEFNGDSRVNSVDFNLQRQNFGTSGSPPIGPASGK